MMVVISGEPKGCTGKRMSIDFVDMMGRYRKTE